MTHPLIRPSHLVFAVAAALPGLAAAAAPAASAYATDAQSSHVEDATSQGIAQVNMITCFVTGMRPDAMVNKGNYTALVDQKKCDPNARSDSGNSSADSAGSSTPSYMSSIVKSTRASNTDPMRVSTWVDMSEKDFSATIFINTVATEAPSAANPYGVFRLDYCAKGTIGGCMILFSSVTQLPRRSARGSVWVRRPIFARRCSARGRTIVGVWSTAARWSE